MLQHENITEQGERGTRGRRGSDVARAVWLSGQEGRANARTDKQEE